jgi:glucose-1-phosphate adenylyltransferase
MAAIVNEPLSRHALAFVLAGGRGSRLLELTDRRAKPAVYFGGKSRIIDFALSNAVNSGIRRIAVATQYKAHSLIRTSTSSSRTMPDSSCFSPGITSTRWTTNAC